MKFSRRNFLSSFFLLTLTNDGAKVPFNFLEQILESPKHNIIISSPKKMKFDLEFGDSNNCVDIIKDDKYYLAFRSAPTHFASSDAKIHVMSSENLSVWTHEKSFDFGNDLREPRFILSDDLRLYFVELGKKWYGFEPKQIYSVSRSSNWENVVEEFEPGFVSWRLRRFNGETLMSVYDGRDTYSSNDGSVAKLLVKKKRGWESLIEISGKGIEEFEFNFDSNGELFGTLRYEGWGGGLVHSKDLENVIVKKIDEKYDSALLQVVDDELYLFARRNLSGEVNLTGNKLLNLVSYSLLDFKFKFG